jgi:hypothetical protein
MRQSLNEASPIVFLPAPGSAPCFLWVCSGLTADGSGCILPTDT